MRDQASDNEKCLTFADLLVGSAKNSFQIKYYGLVVSVARQYYHTRCRSGELPLDYLYRLNIKDASAKNRRDRADYYIETLEDQDVSERLTLLRLTNADDLEAALRARDLAKNRQKKAAFRSNKY
ncbi:hypothetical protein PHMEG_0007567 [Phytophthora megakarya]|uniref:Uncharacterized protein n=1 Tax=Phytophthora megakarya TaxID=4795 RepID=A0A225WLB9_9STRA|nr:hypothetical protein PHMEG_0007567 [Phytophthora megakarya]